MKRRLKISPILLSLALLMPVLLLLLAPHASALTRVRPSNLKSLQGAYTPAEGSAERKAILNALRARVKKFSGLKVVFVVRHLKAHNGWAWAETEPQSPDGANRYEPVSGLLRKKGKRWTVAALLDEGDDRAGAMKKLRARFPSAPADIFP